MGRLLARPPCLSSEESAHFANRLLVYATSGRARHEDEFENTSWWDFTAGATASEEYRRLCVIGPTRSLVAAKAEVAIVASIGRTRWSSGRGRSARRATRRRTGCWTPRRRRRGSAPGRPTWSVSGSGSSSGTG
ncbi:conserved hypothetical protein [Streptomyces sp. Mg1]|nr:conserved hypothetical protein [Streptomyces sp. Mg1]